MMKCPLCSGELEDFDGELICTGKCGAAFSLEYLDRSQSNRTRKNT
jgi:hypothetical protein